MAEIHLTAMAHLNQGPAIPLQHLAYLAKKELGGGTVPILKLEIGDSTITIWPADAEAIGNLGRKLVSIADKLVNECDQPSAEECELMGMDGLARLAGNDSE